MNKVYTKLLLLLLVPFLFLVGCEEEETWRNDPPKVAFSVADEDLVGIELDKGVGPRIKGTVQSDAGLQEVVFEVITSSGREVVETVTTFDEVTSRVFVIDYLPEYTSEVVGLRVLATDVDGRSAGGAVTISAIGGTKGPAMAGFPTKTVNVNIRPSIDERPTIEGTVSSHWGLSSINYFSVFEGDVEEAAGEITDFGDTPSIYSVSFMPDYRLGMTGFKIVAVDGRGNASEHTVSINVIDAAAAPTVAFEEESLEADLTVSPTQEPPVVGTAEANEGLSSVSFYLVSGEAEEQFGETITTFDDPNLLSFEVQPPYRFGVTGIRVEVQDVAGQTASETLPVTVTAEDTDLSVYTDVQVNAQGNRNDAGVVTAFAADGATFTLEEGLNPEVSATIDFITADSGGDNGLDLFSPSHNSWLPNNYFKKDVSGDMTWPVLNETRMLHLGDKDAAYFNAATSTDIRALSVGSDFTTRVEIGPTDNGNAQVNQVLLFETSQGQKGLLLFKNSNNEPGKADVFTFDIKSIDM
jgi:hypothetical protein